MKRIIFLVCLALSSDAYAATRLEDEGTSQGFINEIDCVGAGIACTRSGITGTLTVGAGGDSVLVDTVAITDASGVDLTGGTNGIDIVLDAGVSPDTATFNFDTTEVAGSKTWGNTATNFTWTMDEGSGTDATLAFNSTGNTFAKNFGSDTSTRFGWTGSISGHSGASGASIALRGQATNTKTGSTSVEGVRGEALVNNTSGTNDLAAGVRGIGTRNGSGGTTSDFFGVLGSEMTVTAGTVTRNYAVGSNGEMLVVSNNADGISFTSAIGTASDVTLYRSAVNTLVADGDLEILDASPHLKWDVSAGDDYETYANDSMWFLSNTTDSRVMVKLDGGTGFYLPNLASCDTVDTDANGLLKCGTDATGVGGGDAITVNTSAATDPDFADGDIDWTLTGGNSITATVACSGCIDATDAGTDSVSSDELNATGVEAELESTLDIGGEVTSTGMASTVIADSVTVTGWVLGTSSATQITSPTVIVDLLDANGAVDMDYGSADVTDHTFITDGTTDADFVVPLTSIGAGEIVTDTITATQLNATLTFADGDLLDFGTNISSATEGILIPAHATSCASATAEGQLCWEEDADNLWIGDGAAAKQMNGGTDTNANKEFWFPCSALLPVEAADAIPPIGYDGGTNIDQTTCDMDASADELRTGHFKVPSDVASGTVTVRFYWYSAAATTGDAVLNFRHNSGTAADVDPDVALTTLTVTDTTAGTAGQVSFSTVTETIANLGWAANDLVYFEAGRDANAAGDTLAGDLLLIGVSVDIPRA